MTLRVNKLKNLGICGRSYYFCVDNYMGMSRLITFSISM